MKLPLSYQWQTLRRQALKNSVTVLGVAVAIFLSIAMVGMTRGLVETTAQTGSDQNVIVLSSGAQSVEFSAIDPEVFHRLRSSEFIAQGSSGELASPEVLLSSYLDLGDGAERRGVVRGVLDVAFEVHPEVQIIEGRRPGRGFELAVGALAATKLDVAPKRLALGTKVLLEGQEWTIVGVFEAPGTT